MALVIAWLVVGLLVGQLVIIWLVVGVLIGWLISFIWLVCC